MRPEIENTWLTEEELNEQVELYPCLDFSFLEDYKTEFEVIQDLQAIKTYDAGCQAGRRELSSEIGKVLCCFIGNIMLEDMNLGKWLGEELKGLMIFLQQEAGIISKETPGE